jgi:hypothetical protein
MKNYIIALMAVVILFLVSVIYRDNRKGQAGTTFPVLKETKARVLKEVDVPLYIYVFFSSRNCYDCLQVIHELNDLEPHFIVTGIVHEDELEDKTKLRSLTGATFPLESADKYKKFLPWYSPTIIGVSPNEVILFILPGVPHQAGNILKASSIRCMENSFLSFVGKSDRLLQLLFLITVYRKFWQN